MGNRNRIIIIIILLLLSINLSNDTHFAHTNTTVQTLQTPIKTIFIIYCTRVFLVMASLWSAQFYFFLSSFREPTIIGYQFFLSKFNRKKIAGKRKILSGNTVGNKDNNFISIKFNELTSGIFFDYNYTKKIGSTVYNCV